MIRVAHVITGLGVGGAETMLLKLVEGLREEDVSSTVISLTDRGDLADRLEKAGADVITTGMTRSFASFPLAVLRVRRQLSLLRPNVVQTWMYHADLVGGLAARLSGTAPVLWNLRQSNVGTDVNRASTMLTMWNCARLSGFIPEKIICNSTAAVKSHRELGYDTSRFVVIPNGFDTARFIPDKAASRLVRDQLGISTEAVVLGYVARWDRQKDPGSMVLAAARVMDSRRDVCAVFCGNGLGPENDELRDWIAKTGHASRFHLLGRRDDVASVLAACDVAVSSSVGEGFSNAIGEAMACGVPCVVTNVGDSAMVVGDSGVVVLPGDPGRIAEGILGLVSSSQLRERLGRLARARVEQEFSLQAVAGRYLEVWKEAIACAA